MRMVPHVNQMSHSDSPDLSVVICTYNRAELLRLALETLLRQQPAGLTYEVVVVDNNSTLETRAVVDEVARHNSCVRYVRETRQGNAHARNTGVACARAPIVAFLDDDVTVHDKWLEIILRAFKETNADFVGGKVLPRWEETPPSWLDTANWAPIAALDYGDLPFAITSKNPLCLLTANIAFKKELFSKHGEFSTAVQRTGDSIGSLEDHACRGVDAALQHSRQAPGLSGFASYRRRDRCVTDDGSCDDEGQTRARTAENSPRDSRGDARR